MSPAAGRGSLITSPAQLRVFLAPTAAVFATPLLCVPVLATQVGNEQTGAPGA